LQLRLFFKLPSVWPFAGLIYPQPEMTIQLRMSICQKYTPMTAAESKNRKDD
jgi:hypothetical protein